MQDNKMSFTKTLLKQADEFFKEYDEFIGDLMHKIFEFYYIDKYKGNQEKLAYELCVTQSTVSRKKKMIDRYLKMKYKELIL